MRVYKAVVFWLLFSALALAQGGVIGPKGVLGPKGIAAPGVPPSGNTFTSPSTPAHTFCAAGACSLTIPATTLNNTGIISYTAFTTASFLTAVSSCGTWTIPAGGQGSDAGAGVATSVAYVLNGLTSGCTTLTATASAAGEIYFWEVHSTGSAALDAVGAADISVACTSCAGVTLTLTGTSDVIVQAISGNACSSVTGGPFTTPTWSGFVSNGASAGSALNTSDATPPTWTCTSSRQATSAIAIK